MAQTAHYIIPAEHTTLTRRELKIMDCINELGGRVTIRQICNALNLSVSNALYHLGHMISKGAVEKITVLT